MAARIRCPKCNRMLKEEGDETRDATGEYRVYDSLWNSKYDEKKFRVIKCLLCDEYFHPYIENERSL